MSDDATISDLMRLLGELTEDAEFFQGLGKLFSKVRQGDAADAAYSKSLRLDPCDPFTHLYIGNRHYQKDEYEEALESFEYATGLLPDEAVCYWCQANIYERQERLELADKFYERAVEIDPEDRNARRQLRKWKKRRKNLRPAEESPT